MVFRAIRDSLALDDSIQRKYIHFTPAQIDFQGVGTFFLKRIQPIQRQYNIKQSHRISDQHEWIQADGWNVRSPHLLNRVPKTLVLQIIKPEIDVLGHDGSALQCGRGQAYDHEIHSLVEEFLKEPNLVIGE